MKLHLPTSLRRCLIASLSAVSVFTCAGIAEASYMHQDVSIKTYTDFGQNKGRYTVGNTNALLQYLNKDGVQITYTGGQEAYTMEHGMIDFDSQVSSGEAAAIGYNFIATVNHVSVVDEHYNGGLMDFTRNNLGRSNSVLYTGIEYTGTSMLLKPSQDYKITRLSKLVTDVTGSTVYGAETGDYSGITEQELAGELIYRSGSGHMYQTSDDGSRNWCANPYTYITGGIDTISSINTNTADGCFSVVTYFTYTGEEVGKSEPLPYKADQGDSGSPSWVWNETTEQYEYLSALQSGNANNFSQFRGQCEWTNDTMESFNVAVTMGSDNAVFLNAITSDGGVVSDAAGKELARYNGVVSGTNTWADLSELKDTSNWYNYGDKYLNATKESTSSPMTWADLFYNNNLVVSASSSVEQQVVLNDTVDLGIGYVQFSLGEGMESATFVVKSEEKESNLLNSAGFVVDKGVSVHLQLTNPASYMREWRKVGEGDLCIEGSGNNDVFLNLGGDGATYLKRTQGYAAYNVLANNGTTVVIDNINQIARDFTFGNRGGVLDMNGNSMEWNNSDGAGADGFTIHALDEGAVVVNRAAGTHTSLTWTQTGAQTWKGSFADTADSSLKFVYNGGGTLTMNSILTNLQHADSGVEVQSGKVLLVGTNTVHALGSQGAWNSSARYSSTEDWHYADARMDVSVGSGSTFELGSHARLTGDVSVATGGTYIMREGVKNRYEYIEGGYVKEDTDTIRAFFGHKGNVSLASGATMQVEFSAGTDSTLVYEGNISGEGNVSVNAQGGILKLGGTSDFSGSKQLTQGGLWAASNAALGDTSANKWVIGEKSWLASDGFTEASQILRHIDSSSTGVLALSQDVTGQIDLSQHTGLIIGAAEGSEVHYGTASETLNAVNGQWVLGGGGGNLVVDFKLSGENDLVLGNTYGKGNVHLSNAANDFSGDIRYVGGVTLSYEEGALGNAMIDLSYGNRALLVAEDISKVKTAWQGVSQGVVLVDRMATADIDLSSHTGLALGAAGDVTFSGNITLAEGNPYRFGGGDGCLTVATTLASGCDMVIDGQGYTGGSVVLAHAQSFNGHVAMMGSTGAVAGDVTLRFVEDNSLTGARGFTISNGGKIDLAGTNQQLAGVELVSGGTITDSSAERSSTLTLTSGSIGSGSVVDVAHVVKAGSGTLTLSNSSLNYSDFAVEGGTLKLGAAAKGAFRVAEGAVFDMSGYGASGSVTLQSGATLQNVKWLTAALHVQGNSTLKTSSSGSELSSAISVDAGAELSVQAGSAAFSLAKGSSLNGAGSISITSSNTTAYSAVSFGGNNSAFTGRLSVVGNGSNAVYFGSVGAFGAGAVALDNIAFSMVDVNTADTAVAATLEVGEKGTTFRGGSGGAYYFSGLSGSGTLSSASYSGGAMWFSGDVSGFAGTLDNDSSNYADDTLRFGFGGSGVSYHSVTGNNSEGAAALFGEGTRLRSSTASVTYEFRYADKVALNATVEDRANLTQSGSGTLVLGSGNTSTGVLTINSGTVELAEGSTWAGSLAGSGTLANMSTEAVTIASASGFAGSLELAQGSSLTLGANGGESFSLGSGQHLSLLAVADSAEQIRLNVSTLELNGGTLSFSGDALVLDGGAALYLSSGNGRVINGSGNTQTSLSFFDTSGLAVGEYALIQGNLSGIAGNTYTVSGLDCFNASFSMVNNKGILLMTLSEKEGNRIWAGTASQNGWDSGFGDSAPAEADTVWFNDAAVEKTVVVSGEQKAGTLVFDASEDYVLSTSDGTLSAGNLELRDEGKVTLGSGISISGTTTLAAGSELVVNDFSTLGGTISGEGTLTIDAAGKSDSLSLSNLGALRLQSGTYDLTENASVGTIETAGGQLSISRTGATSYTCNLLLGGGGDKTALSMSGSGRANLNGTINLTSDVGVNVTGDEALFNSTLRGNGHTITKTGSGRLWLATAANGGFTANDVSFVVEAGELRLGGTVNKEIPDGIVSLTLKDGAVLGFCAKDTTFGSALSLEGGSMLHLSNGAGADTVFSYTFTGDMTLNASASSGKMATLATAKGRKLTLSGLISGDGGFAIDGSAEIQLTLNNANNSFSGGIEAKDRKVTINLAAAGAAGTGDIFLNNAESKLNIAGNDDGSYGAMVNAVSGAAAVEISSGRVEMTGSNTYGGSTTVKEGAALKLSSANTGSSAYVVERGAQLLLSGNGFATMAGKGVTLRARSNSRSRAAVEGVLENVTVSDALMTATDSQEKGSVHQALVQIDAQNYTISGLELTDTSVQATGGAVSLELSDLVLGSGTTFQGTEGSPWELSLQNVTLSVTLAPEMQDGNLHGVAGSNNVALYRLTNFTDVSLAGDLMLDVAAQATASTLSTSAGAPGYVAFDFGDSISLDNLSLSAVLGGSTVLSQVKVTDSVVLYAVSSSDAVPEPATSALSLFGLAALALRRRRK